MAGEVAGGPLMPLVPKDVIINFLGPVLVGCILAWGFNGLLFGQTYWYQKSFWHKDGWIVKAAVLFVFLLCWVQTVIITSCTWEFLVEGWGDVEVFAGPQSSASLSITLLNGLACLVVQLFYAHKIYKLMDQPWNTIASGLVVLLAIGQCAAAAVTSILAITSKITFADFPKYNAWALPWLIMAPTNDILITTLLTWTLLRRRTGMKRTDDLLSKLSFLIVQTGLAACVIQLLDLITLRSFPGKGYNTAAVFCSAHVYANSMLAVLNARTPIGSVRDHNSIALGPCTSDPTSRHGLSTLDNPEKGMAASLRRDTYLNGIDGSDSTTFTNGAGLHAIPRGTTIAVDGKGQRSFSVSLIPNTGAQKVNEATGLGVVSESRTGHANLKEDGENESGRRGSDLSIEEAFGERRQRGDIEEARGVRIA